MAYIADPEEDELKKQQAGGQTTSGVVGAAASGGPTSSGAPGVDTAAPTSTGFVNLQSYLDANPGTGSGLAGAATKDLSNQVGTYGQTAQNTVAGAKSGFDAASGDAQAGQIKSGLAQDASGTYGQAASFLGSNYTGPKASDYSGDLKTQQGSLNASLGKVDNTANQQDLLKSAYTKPDISGATPQYTNGFGQLDSFLIGGSQDGRDAIAGVKAKTADVDGAYNGAVNQLTGMQQGAQNRLASNQAGIKDAARSDATGIVNSANPLINQKNAGLVAGNIGTAKASAGDVLSDKNRQDLQALSQLSGDAYNPDWNKKTFNAGSAAPVNPYTGAPPAASSPDKSLAQVTGFAPIMKAGGDISDTTKKAGADVANSFKNPSSPVIQAPNPIEAVAKYVAPRFKKPKF